MTDGERINGFIVKGDAAGLKQWELAHEGPLDDALLQKIDAYLKSEDQWYGGDLRKPGEDA